MKSINPKQTVDSLVSFLTKSFAHAGFSDAIIGVSGGVDSATSLALTVRALGKDHVYPVILPYSSMSEQSTKDGKLVIDALGLTDLAQTIDIQPTVDAFVAHDPRMNDARKGNVMARARMMVLFDLAKKHHALVVGTENKSEHLLGYYTRFGDEASDIEPLRGLYKTQVYELATYLEVPEPILTKAPTAGLWEGQTDEGQFGFSYKEADEIIFLLYDENKTVKQVIDAGFSKDTILRVQTWVEANAYKHHLPILL